MQPHVDNIIQHSNTNIQITSGTTRPCPGTTFCCESWQCPYCCRVALGYLACTRVTPAPKSRNSRLISGAQLECAWLCLLCHEALEFRGQNRTTYFPDRRRSARLTRRDVFLHNHLLPAVYMCMPSCFPVASLASPAFFTSETTIDVSRIQNQVLFSYSVPSSFDVQFLVSITPGQTQTLPLRNHPLILRVELNNLTAF